VDHICKNAEEKIMLNKCWELQSVKYLITEGSTDIDARHNAQ